AGETRAHALVGACAFDDTRAGVAQHLRENAVARPHDGNDFGNRRSKVSTGSDADRRSCFDVVDRVQQWRDELVAPKTFAASRGEKNADYPHITPARPVRGRFRVAARSWEC